MTNKVHYLKDGLYGLYDNHLMTYCGVLGYYAHNGSIRHHRTFNLYTYTNNKDKVTCLSCKEGMHREFITKKTESQKSKG